MTFARMLTVLALLAARTAAAQARDASAHMERVADGVYAIIHDDATEQWPNSQHRSRRRR